MSSLLRHAAPLFSLLFPEKNSGSSQDSRGTPRFSERLWPKNSEKCWLIFAVISL
jgi:hypothetical protein